MLSTPPAGRSTRGAAQSHPSTATTSTDGDGDNPLLEALDEGVLTVKKSYRDFGVFLDIKKELRGEFLTSLWSHVVHNHYVWDTMVFDELERRECATSFLAKVGMKYWGTKENREKCLMPESLKDPENLFTYPERKRE